MKKMMFIISVMVIAGCSSGDKKKAGDTKTDIQPGTENVNGNIPDSTNAIDLNTDKKDSTSSPADSTR